MTIFLILAPYGAFASLMLVTSAAVSLFAGAAICLAVIAFDSRATVVVPLQRAANRLRVATRRRA